MFLNQPGQVRLIKKQFSNRSHFDIEKVVKFLQLRGWAAGVIPDGDLYSLRIIEGNRLLTQKYLRAGNFAGMPSGLLSDLKEALNET